MANPVAESLATRIRRGPLGVDLAIALGRQIGEALSVAHERGARRSGLQPERILLVPDAGQRCGFDVEIAEATASGQENGEAIYRAPEQSGDGPASESADIFSLGCILYEMACGRQSPGGFASPAKPRTLNASISPELETILLRALARRPEDRQPTLAALARELAALPARRFSSGTPDARWFMQTAESTLGESTPPPHSSASPEQHVDGTLAQRRSDSVDLPSLTDIPRLPSEPLATTLGAAPNEHASPVRALVPTKSSASANAHPRRSLGGNLAIAAAFVGLFVVAMGVLYQNDPSSFDPALVWIRSVLGLSPQASALVGSPAPNPAPSAGLPSLQTVASHPQSQTASTSAAHMITIRIDSHPRGAEVIRALDGSSLGQTPLVQNMVGGSGETVFLLRHPGYRDQRVMMSMDRSGSTLATLSRLKTSGPGAHDSHARVSP